VAAARCADAATDVVALVIVAFLAAVVIAAVAGRCGTPDRRIGAPGPSGASVTYGAHISHSGAQSKPEKERFALVTLKSAGRDSFRCGVLSHDPIDWGTIGRPLSGEPGICT
jgi:hypothetical protein